ncbi:c-type cytochrome [Ohtaekwangia sp.]|uniref:c-type cytochrome n=1 Tax=Ohtaekwangia sp. TaxID=2066019 RepID=UPI002F95FF10
MKLRSTYMIITMIAATGFSLLAFQQKPKFDIKASIARGKEIYTTQCITCHMEQGEGLEGVYPPLAKSDYLMADKKRSIQQIIHGVSGEIKVNGVTYSGDMPAVELTDEQVSDVLNYVRNAWGNKGDAVKPEEAKAAR